MAIDKVIIKEIFLLLFEIIKALFEMLLGKIKGWFGLFWNRFFKLADVSYGEREEEPEQEWGVTGEDEWASIPEASLVKQEEPQQKVERREDVFSGEIQEIPGNYGDNRIVLMVRDPEWLFVYWELQGKFVDDVRSAMGSMAYSAKVVLRVYDVTDIIFNGNNAHKYFDIEIRGGARNWYIKVGESDRSFCVDMGFLTSYGTFFVIVRSNVVKTPRVGVSEIIDEEWMSVKELYEKVYIPAGSGVSESIFESAHKNWLETHKLGVSSTESFNCSTIIKK